MTTTTTKIAAEYADREAIRECLARYARGVDRVDADMLRSAYWPEATGHDLDFHGNIEEFIAWSFPLLKQMDQTMRIMGSTLMTIEGETAGAESYFYGYHRITMDGKKQDVIAAGRYLDRFEKRNDEWRIIERRAVTDWFRQYPDSADWDAGLLGMKVELGRRFPEDASYTMLNLK